MGRLLQQSLARQLNAGISVGRETVLWVFPLTVTAGWILWPTLNEEWLIDMGLATHPDIGVQKVQADKEARLVAHKQAKTPAMPEMDSTPMASVVVANDEEVDDDDDDEESESVDVEKETNGEEEVEEEEDEDAGANGAADDEEDAAEEEEEEDEEEIVIKPLYTIVKEPGNENAWDNFSIKAIRMTDEDDDDDEDGKWNRI